MLPKFKIKLLSLLLVGLFIFTGCSQIEAGQQTDTTAAAEQTEPFLNQISQMTAEALLTMHEVAQNSI
mgnify:CR=1 FL=1